MPIYDYQCQGCKKKFIVEMTVDKYSKGPRVSCPKCKNKKVQRIFSSVSVITSKKS
jgi:putative FmdB family regulatory protein